MHNDCLVSLPSLLGEASILVQYDSSAIASMQLCIEDAERVEDPILFERPCNPEGLEVILKCVLHEVQRTVPKASILASTLCIEDARSLVTASKAVSASKRNFSTD